jgi:hypothetical protein
LASCPGDKVVVPDIVQFHAVLEEAPDVDCIWNRLIEFSKPRKVLTIRDEIPKGVSHRFDLNDEQISFSVQVFLGNDGSKRFSTSARAKGGTLDEMQLARNTLMQVNKLMNGECGLDNILGTVRENCVGSLCDQM